MSVRIPPDSEKSSLVRIEGDPQGVRQAKRELLDLASRMVRPAALLEWPAASLSLACAVLGVDGTGSAGLRRGAGRRRAELSLGQTLESPPPEHRPQALRSTFQDAQDTPGWARASEGKSHWCELLRRRRGGVRRALLPRARRQHSRVTAASLHRCRLSAPCSA